MFLFICFLVVLGHFDLKAVEPVLYHMNPTPALLL
jgi:hypothetical protein